jgi:internalin A
MSDLAVQLIAENKRSRAASLDLSNSGLTEVPAEVGELVWLKLLSLAGTPVTDLTPLAGLSALQSLDLSSTPVTDLAPLAGLSALQTLNLSRTQVTDLFALVSVIAGGCPVRWSSKSWEGPGIYVESCPLVNPPPEIANQGNEAILNYFQERKLGEIDHLFEAKMLILGEGSAGKTSLLRRLYQPGQPLPTQEESTKGISIYRHEFKLPNGRPSASTCGISADRRSTMPLTNSF